MNILVTGVGGPTPRSFVRAVKLNREKSKNLRFIGADCNQLAYGLYDRSLFDRCFLVPRADHKNYWSRINEIVRDEHIDCAVVLPEVEVLEWARNSGKLEQEIHTHLPDLKLAEAIVNKRKLHDVLHGSDLIPRFSKLIPGKYSYQDVVSETGTPFWIRSTEGSSGLGSLKIESEDALAQWISINPNVKEFIATEYLPGRNMACKMLYFHGKLLRTACAERVHYIMAKVAPSGITGNTSFGRLINEPRLVELSEEALNLVANQMDVEIHGMFTVDYKEDAGDNPKITEINIRHVAFTSAMAAGGANIPADTLDLMVKKDTAKTERIDYRYKEPMIFLRDVDALPIVMPEKDLLKPDN